MNSNNTKLRTRLRQPAMLIGACLALVLSGCGSLSPKPYESQEIRDRVTQDRIQMYADQEPINGPFTFHDAAARSMRAAVLPSDANQVAAWTMRRGVTGCLAGAPHMAAANLSRPEVVMDSATVQYASQCLAGAG